MTLTEKALEQVNEQAQRQAENQAVQVIQEIGRLQREIKKLQAGIETYKKQLSEIKYEAISLD